MFFRRTRKAAPISGAERLEQAVRAHLPKADASAQRLVVAVAGLLAGVAYADREYSPPEQARVREALDSIHGLSPESAEAICALLRDHIIEIATINPQAYTRAVRELCEVELRREVLELLVDLAAADGEIAVSESDLLRRTTSALGLSQDDYNAAQAKHRDKLRALR